MSLSLTSTAAMRQDRQQHMHVGAISALGLYGLSRAGGHTKYQSLYLAMGFAIALQVGKESIDSKWDTQDLGAGVLGASVALVLPFRWEF